jgi:peptidoglycan-N-acetylglucosamine deacetylase
MDRRSFAATLGLAAAGLALRGGMAAPADGPRRLAITIDDFNLFGATPQAAGRRNAALLEALGSHSGVKAAAFVCGRQVDSDLGKSLVSAWGRAGHMVANHTYSHWYYPRRNYEEFSQDALRAERLLEGLPGFTRRFRFPYLKEGDTREKRDRMRAFLAERGYKTGYVTIDASDWYFDQRLRDRLAADPKADPAPYRDVYLKHLRDRAAYYDGLSRKVLGRSVKHTLLIHHNVLNEMFLADALKMFEAEGWKVIDAADAFSDPVFSTAPDILPAGESILWALAKQSGRFEDQLRYPGEDGDYEKPAMDALGL